MIVIIIMGFSSAHSRRWLFLSTVSRSNWNLECGFLWRGENRRTRRKTLRAGTRTNSKLNPHVTIGPEIEPGDGRRALSPLRHPHSLFRPALHLQPRHSD